MVYLVDLLRRAMFEHEQHLEVFETNKDKLATDNNILRFCLLDKESEIPFPEDLTRRATDYWDRFIAAREEILSEAFPDFEHYALQLTEGDGGDYQVTFETFMELVQHPSIIDPQRLAEVSAKYRELVSGRYSPLRDELFTEEIAIYAELIKRLEGEVSHMVQEAIAAIRELDFPFLGSLDFYVGRLESGMRKLRTRGEIDITNLPEHAQFEEGETITGSNSIYFPSSMFGRLLELDKFDQFDDCYVSRGPFTNEGWDRLAMNYLQDALTVQSKVGSIDDLPQPVARYVHELQHLAARALMLQNRVLAEAQRYPQYDSLEYQQKWAVYSIAERNNPEAMRVGELALMLLSPLKSAFPGR
ncbi:MAG: hypothetical protein ABH879_04130 [archaeon]